MQLIAEDVNDVNFHWRENSDPKTIRVLECFDKYYPKKIYRLDGNSQFTYKSILMFVFLQFRYRNLQIFRKDLNDFVEEFKIPLLIYVRDEYEPDDRHLID